MIFIDVEDETSWSRVVVPTGAASDQTGTDSGGGGGTGPVLFAEEASNSVRYDEFREYFPNRKEVKNQRYILCCVH